MLLEQVVTSILDLPDCHAITTVACSPFPSERLDKWRSWLRDDELQRVSSYRNRVDQELFVARRGLARESIAQTGRVRPSSIYFQRDSMGKLSWSSDDLDHQQSNSIRKLDFSISKSIGIVAMSVIESARVGVDVETIEALPELEMLAMQNLHPDELQVWNTIPPIINCGSLRRHLRKPLEWGYRNRLAAFHLRKRLLVCLAGLFKSRTTKATPAQGNFG